MLKKFYNRDFLYPIGTFIVLVSVVLTFWNHSINNYDRWIKDQLLKTGYLTTQHLKSILDDNVERLKSLKRRLEFTDGSYFNYWERDAEIILELNDSFKFVEWIDNSMIIRKIQPLAGNEAVIGLDLSKIEYRKDEWLSHTANKTINITNWAKLTQGGHAFLVDVPVYFQNSFQGTISAGMDFTSDLNEFSLNLKDYCVELRDNKETLFFSYNIDSINAIDKDLVYENKLLIDDLHNHSWHLKIYPTNQLRLDERLAFINFSLYVGLFFALLISLLVYYFMLAKKENEKTIKSNSQLSKLNNRLNKERNKAEKASQAKTDFLSNMSHEIRTPLHAILGFIQVLKNSDLDETNKEYINLMDKSSSNLLSLVNDVLEIDKIESGNLHVEEIYFNPAQKLKDLLDVYKFHFSAKQLYVQSEFIEPIGINVLGDQNKLLQILINLLKNALKFTVTGGIHVTYKEEIIHNLLKVSITLEDTGIGIPENKIDTVFNRFMQIDDSLKKQHEGSGLGLAISKDLAKLLGGNINVESNVKQGSKFSLSVVFKIAEDQNKFSINETFKNITLTYLKVLIVDDNKINVIVLQKLLEDIGIQVDTAANGVLALEKIGKASYNLILMDIHMPEMDGFEATQKIREKDTKIIIFGLSANVTKSAITKALDCGMNNYLSKPFTKERLYKLILTYFN